MKEHEDCDMVSVEKSSVVEEIVTKIEGEDMMVDVVGADAVDLDRKADSERLNETETRDLNKDTKEEVAGSGEEDDCQHSVGSRVLALEKVEITVKEERLETSIEVRDCETDIESKGECRFGEGEGDTDVTGKDSTVEQNVESVVECKQKETETRDLNMDTEEAAVTSREDVCGDSVGSGVLAFEKVEETVIEEGLNTSLEVTKDVLQGNDATTCESLERHSKESLIDGGDIVVIESKDLMERGTAEEVVEENVESVEEVANGNRVLDKKSKKEAEISDSSKIAESLEVDTIVVEDEAEKSVSVDPSLVYANNQNFSTELVNVGTDEVAGKSKEESPLPTIEVTTDDSQGNESVEPRSVGGENDTIDKEEESDRGLPKEITEQPMECDQQVADGDRVLDEKIVKESEALDSSKVSEPLTTTNPGSEDVDVVVVDEGLTSKDEAQDGVYVDPSSVCADNRSSSTQVANSATSEGDVVSQAENVDQLIPTDAQNLENGTGVGDEVLTTANLGQEEVLTPKIAAQDSDFVGQKLVFPDNQSSPTENSDHQAEVDTTEIATCTEVDEVRTVSEVQVTDAGGIDGFDENQSLKVNAVLDNSIHQTTPATIANKVVKTEIVDQDCIVYVEDQGLKAGAKPSNEVPITGEMNGFQVSADAFEEVNGVTPCPDVVNHRVVHEDSGFSYEDGHMERGEDAGMDIDEVLGWKDEIPPIEDQHFNKINAESEGGNVANNLASSPGFKKRKALDSVSEVSEKKPSLNPDKGPSPLFLTPKPSFKVGECIQRVASQLSGPPNGQHVDQLVGSENHQREKMSVENTQSSVAEMLSQLHLFARDPMKGYNFFNTIIPFFYDHRAVGRPVSVRKRKPSNENEPEEFEFDDVNDSYWTDRIIQNHPEEQPLQDNNQNGGQERHVVAYEPDKPAKANRRSNKKRFMFSNHEMGLKEQSELVERRRQNLATEVVLKFPMGIYFPSEIHLNKMFRRFGALMESETEVDRQNGRARVVFKKCCDAEVAHSSAGKFNIFGPINVNYELNYTPLVSYKPLPLSILQQDSMDGS